MNRRRIWVAGHKGVVGSAVVRRLRGDDVEVLLSIERKST